MARRTLTTSTIIDSCFDDAGHLDDSGRQYDSGDVDNPSQRCNFDHSRVQQHSPDQRGSNLNDPGYNINAS